jgi:hypothetical protein
MDDLDLAATSVMWDVMSEDEKLAALEEVINDTLADLGYEQVDVESDTLDGNAGETSEGTITLDSGTTLFDDPFSEALDTAFHETAHEMDDQDGISAALPDDEIRDFNAVNPDDDTGHTTQDPLHENVEDYAAAMVKETSDRLEPILGGGGGGGGGPAGAVGAGESDAGDSGHDFSFDIDYAGVTVTDADSDSSADFDFEIDTANVEVSP